MRFLTLTIGIWLTFGLAAQPLLAQTAAQTDSGLTSYVEGFNTVFADGDIDAWLELWAKEAKRVLPSSHQEGLMEIREAYISLYEAYSQMRLVEMERQVSGAEGRVECQFEGVLRSNGNPVSQPVTLVLRFDSSGKILHLRAEFDEEAFLAQLRAQRA